MIRCLDVMVRVNQFWILRKVEGGDVLPLKRILDGFWILDFGFWIINSKQRHPLLKSHASVVKISNFLVKPYLVVLSEMYVA